MWMDAAGFLDNDAKWFGRPICMTRRRRAMRDFDDSDDDNGNEDDDVERVMWTIVMAPLPPSLPSQ